MHRYYSAIATCLCLAASGCGSPAEVPDAPQSPLARPAPPSVPPEPPKSRGAGDIAGDPYPTPLPLVDAERILLNTNTFSYRNLARQIQAYNVLLDQPDAFNRVRAIAARARRAGQLYALCALWDLNPDAARAFAAELTTIQDPVLVFANDVVSDIPVAKMVALIEAEKLWVEFRKEKAAIDHWLKRAG
jgi:hypothetical protein